MKESGDSCLVVILIFAAIALIMKYGFSTISGIFVTLFIVGIILERIQKREEEQKKSSEHIAKEKEEKERAELKQRQGYATEFKQKLKNVADQCWDHKAKSDNAKLEPKYEAIALQKELWGTVDTVSTSLQGLDDIVSELKTKENK